MAPRPPRQVRVNTTPLFLFFGLVALLAVILGLIGRVNKKMIENAEVAAEKQAVEEERKASVDPFADLPDEVGLGEGARGSRWATALPRPKNPTGLEADPVWQAALDQADAAWVLADQARRAFEAEDKARGESKGRAAREGFERALASSAQWAADRVAELGDRDAQLRKILRTRDQWAEQVRHLVKTAGY